MCCTVLRSGETFVGDPFANAKPLKISIVRVRSIDMVQSPMKRQNSKAPCRDLCPNGDTIMESAAAVVTASVHKENAVITRTGPRRPG